MRMFTLLFLFVCTAHAAAPALPSQDFSKYQILLMGGIYNEARLGYFAGFEKFLTTNGATHVAQYMPSSRRTVGENAPKVAEEIIRLHRESGRPVVAFGHSKGGVELVNAIGLRASDLPPEVLAGAVTVNSPLKGSPATDQMIGKLRPWAGLYVLTPSYQNNIRVLESISEQGVKAEMERSYSKVTPAELKSLSDRLFYVRSVQTPGDVELMFRNQAYQLEKLGPNDGLVPLSSQKLESFHGLEQFGRDTGVILNRDHMDLFEPKNTNDPAQAEVFRGIFRSITENRAAGCAGNFSALGNKP